MNDKARNTPYRNTLSSISGRSPNLQPVLNRPSDPADKAGRIVVEALPWRLSKGSGVINSYDAPRRFIQELSFYKLPPL